MRESFYIFFGTLILMFMAYAYAKKRSPEMKFSGYSIVVSFVMILFSVSYANFVMEVRTWLVTGKYYTNPDSLYQKAAVDLTALFFIWLYSFIGKIVFSFFKKNSSGESVSEQDYSLILSSVLYYVSSLLFLFLIKQTDAKGIKSFSSLFVPIAISFVGTLKNALFKYDVDNHCLNYVGKNISGSVLLISTFLYILGTCTTLGFRYSNELSNRYGMSVCVAFLLFIIALGSKAFIEFILKNYVRPKKCIK